MKLHNCIYRFLNINGEVIYIGKAKDLTRRLSNHNHLPPECYAEKVLIDFTVFETEQDMDLAERYYIPKYKPKYNTILREHLLSLDIERFDNVKWFKYNPHLIIENKEELEQLLEIHKINRRIKTLQAEINDLEQQEGNIERITYLKNDLDRNIKTRLILLVGREQFYALSEDERTLYTKYNVTSREGVLSAIYDEIVAKQVQGCKAQLIAAGYYNYSNLVENIYTEFKYIPYFNDKKWLHWIDNIPSLPVESAYTPKIRSVVSDLVDRVESILYRECGLLTTDTIIGIEPFTLDATVDIPKALLVKRIGQKL